MNHAGPALAFIGVIYLAAFLAIYIATAIGNGYVAARLGRSVPVWVILTLIPIVNFFFFIYVFYVVLLFVIDKLMEIQAARSD